MKSEHIQKLPVGHNDYPNGCVIHIDYDNMTPEDEPTVTEYTLKAWAEQQQSQQD